VLSDRVEEASTRSKKKDVFLSHFSHDVRTPLNNIIHAVRMLRAGKGTGIGLDELLEIILASCKRINRQIDEVLDYSRSEAGALAPNPEVIGIGLLSADIENSWKHAFADKCLSFEVAVDEELWVKCDRGHLLRIVDNLISNALKYTDVGGVTVDVYQSKRGQVVRVDVSDSGVGLTPEEQARVFTPFERFGRGGVDGVGLGLSVTKTLVEKNHGAILLESEYGRGTTVSVELPRYIPVEEAGEGELVSKSTGPITGMVIEDDQDFRALMSRMLAEQGFVVVEASSIVEAREKARDLGLAFLIADYGLSGGVIQLESLIESLGSDVRVAIMSGYCLAGKVSSAYRVFRKPFEMDEVVRWLKFT
jgi:CheY-like chemotaxis protein